MNEEIEIVQDDDIWTLLCPAVKSSRLGQALLNHRIQFTFEPRNIGTADREHDVFTIREPIEKIVIDACLEGI